MINPLRLNYSKVRWLVVGLLFVATVLNYVDRQTLSILSPTLRHDLHLSEKDYSNVVSAFLLSYLIMYSVAGRLIDRFGVRIGAAACVGWWSLASALTSFATGPFSLAGARFLLGVGEPGIFPAGLKACGEWFPRKMRALPAGIFSSGVSVGAVVAAPLIAFVTLHYGWHACFFICPTIGLFVWVPLWLLIYRSPAAHPAVTPAELAALNEDSVPAQVSWKDLIKQRKVWGLVLPRLASDPVWYFYLFWLPDYFQRIRHLSLAEIGFYGWIPFLFADLGNVAGGATSDWLIRRGWTPARARFAMLATVGCLSPLGALVGFIGNTGATIALTCLITFLCQMWATNSATLATDISGRAETATVVGMMGSAGGLGGILFAQLLWLVINLFGYSGAFAVAAVLHPIAALTAFFLLRPWLAASTPNLESPCLVLS